jgi:hypothetical protein
MEMRVGKTAEHRSSEGSVRSILIRPLGAETLKPETSLRQIDLYADWLLQTLRTDRSKNQGLANS